MRPEPRSRKLSLASRLATCDLAVEGSTTSCAAMSAALALNGCFLGTGSVPALLLFVLWTLLASVYLLRWAWRRPGIDTPAARQAGHDTAGGAPAGT